MNSTDIKENKYKILVTKEKIAPCIGCHEVCTPESCSLLDEWLELLM